MKTACLRNQTTDIATSRLVFTARLRPQFQMPPVRNARRASIAAHRCCSSTAAARWCCTPLPASAYHSIGGGLPKWQISKSISVSFVRIKWNFFYNTRETQTQKWWITILKFEFCDFWEFFEIFNKESHGPSADGPIWTIMVAAKVDTSRVLVTKFHWNRSTMKGRRAGHRHTVGWLVGWGLTALLTQNRSYRACRFVGIFYSKL